MTKPTILLTLCLLLALAAPTRAQFAGDNNHPELDWQVLETEHFKIYYHQGLENLAQRAVAAAEEAYGPVTRFYAFEPDEKIRLILKDTDDYANGAAFYYHNTMEIWASSLNLDFEFRGTKTDWLKNVFTHEFTHMVSLQTARKGPRRIPAFYFHYFGYQSEGRREDILTGYPNTLASYAVPLTIVPPWFAEGTAQYMAEGVHYDRWDSHRDMILRMATLNNTLLTYEEMSVFGAKTGLGYEKVYDHGYALTLYIANTFGEEKLSEIYRNMATWWRTDFSGAIQNALGISGRELHRQWVASLQERYRVQQAEIGNPAIGDSVFSDGYANYHPHWSPDGKQLAFLSNTGGDYGRTNLFTYTFSDSSLNLVAPGAHTSFDWSVDGKKLLFSRRSAPNTHGSKFWDLYTVDPSVPLKSGFFGSFKAMVGLSSALPPGETRLSHSLRSVYPAYSPDEHTIVFVQNGAGSANLALQDVETGQVKTLTSFTDGTQVFTPRWSPDGQNIVFSIFTPDGSRSIALIPANGGPYTLTIASSGTDRDPCWTSDGTGLVFSSDLDGIFNLYHLDLETSAVHRITRTVGGAIQPHVNPQSGRIAFSHYGKNAFEIRTIDARGVWEPVPDDTFTPVGPTPPTPQVATTEIPIEKTRPYKNEFSTLSILPRIALDDSAPKLGFFTSSDDVMGKQTLFVGGLIGTNLDIDLFALYEYRRLRPTLFLEAFRATRHVDEDVINRDQDFRIYDRTFSLNEINLGLKYKMRRGGLLDGRFIFSRYSWVLDQARFNGLNRSTVGATYLNGFDLALTYSLNSIRFARDSEINPHSGREITFRYDRFFNFFLRDFKENSSLLIEVYDHFFYNQATLDWVEHVPLGPGRNTLGIRFYGGFLDHAVDDFFDLHIGGLSYMKGYTFYSMEGRRAAMLRTAYRFPLWRGINRQTGPIYSDQIYGSLYAGIGRAWDGNAMDDPLKRGWKKDVGAQIRYDATSFYIFPTRISFDVAYGFDTVPLIEPGDPTQRSGLKFYFTLLFGYLESVGSAH
ncbi:MAG: hypothetical protein O2954_09090 [bacterium]|nr:hypothetical protein [bacterium]